MLNSTYQQIKPYSKVLLNSFVKKYCGLSLITLSEHGIYATDHNTSSYAKAHAREITDVSGAGDTVIATATLCYISGASVEQIAKISNIAGGMVCEKPGVVSVIHKDLLKEVKELL